MYDNFGIADFVECLKIGHEIEFCFDGDYFFVQPYYEYNKFRPLNLEDQYLLYKAKFLSDNQAQRIYSGTCDEILHFHIKDDLSIIHDFEKFTLLFVL